MTDVASAPQAVPPPAAPRLGMYIYFPSPRVSCLCFNFIITIFLYLFGCTEGEQLEDAVTKQIEYYFSRQNLATDAYLVSQMDSEMWVPISTIAGFKVNIGDIHYSQTLLIIPYKCTSSAHSSWPRTRATHAPASTHAIHLT